MYPIAGLIGSRTKFYQIFPDRFASSQADHGVQEGVIFIMRPVARYLAASGSSHWMMCMPHRHFMVAIWPVLVRKSLIFNNWGYGAVFEPHFTAPSVHKYDTEDYYQVDPYLGRA